MWESSWAGTTGFGLAAIGMLSGNLTFYFFRAVLEEKGAGIKRCSKTYASIAFLLFLGVILTAKGLEHESVIFPYVPWISLIAVIYVAYSLMRNDAAGTRKIAKAVLYILGIALFFAAEEQMGTSITLFSDRHATKSFWCVPISPSLLLSINPAVIILFGTLMNKFTKSSGSIYRMVLPFAMASLAFIGLSWACHKGDSMQPVPIILVMGMVLAVALAELMIGPSVYCFCSELSSQSNQGMVMGLVPIGFSLASAIGGYLAKWMAADEAPLTQSLTIYREGFLAIGLLMLGAAIVLGIGLTFVSKFNYGMRYENDSI